MSTITDANKQSNPQKWPAYILFFVAGLQLLLVLASLIASTVSNNPSAQISVWTYLILLVPLFYIVIAIYEYRTTKKATWTLCRIATYTGIILGILLGILLMVPGGGLALLIGPFTLFYHLYALVTGIPLAPFVIVAGSVLAALVPMVAYGLCAWLSIKKIGAIKDGLGSALLAAAIATIIASLIAAIIYHLPLLWSASATSTDIHGVGSLGYAAPLPMLNYLMSYYGLFQACMYLLVTQLLLALVGGRLSALLHQIKSRQNHTKNLAY